mmetsp:Transcript_10651/g.27886  ORF Transcript_10651/g.27886 Transcript_10651/m.27886 type:complete len:93 (+) Transcript_10651:739-1017(+)
MRTTPHFHTDAGRGLDEEGEKGRGDALPFYYCLATHPLIVHYYNCYSVPLTSTSLLVRMLPHIYLSSTSHLYLPLIFLLSTSRLPCQCRSCA